MLDFDHLSRQTLGDRALERRILELFVAQSDALIARLQSAGDPREVAHTINGSARAIGAFDLASVATRIEAAEAPIDNDIDELVAAFERTRTFVADHLGK